jgi:superoxide dismutase, Cu-Zn family
MNALNVNSLIAGLLLVGVVGTYSCSSMKSSVKKRATATILPTKSTVSGSGTIRFIQDGNEVDMELELTLPSKAGQTVAVHIHEHGDCGNEGNDAHGHWNPTKANHGKWGQGQFHLGDIGNVQLDASGKGSIELETSLWSVGSGASNDVVGKAIMVHEKADDFTTQPTGNAGARVACGVIQISNK